MVIQQESELKISLRGTDSLIKVDSDEVVSRVASLLGGKKPKYWGRYFSGIDYTGTGEYFVDDENNILRKHGIRVLPVGRYTNRVGLGKSEGMQDGKNQAQDFVFSFGEDYLSTQEDGEYYIFLDVEPSPPLSAEYYQGWAEGVQNISSKVKMLPCVYLNASDSVTSSALNDAIKSGAPCHGLWIACYDCFNQPTLPQDIGFNPNLAKPETSVNAPVLLWQYAGDIGPNTEFDFSISNPSTSSTQLLRRLILPQEV